MPKLQITRRVRIGVRWLEPFGIKRGDTAIVAMTGDVRIGELGLFETTSCGYSYTHFRFVRKQGRDCRSWLKRQKGGVCLREAEIKGDERLNCRATHEGFAYGRVIAVERNDQPVETSLEFRRLDEREQATTELRQRPTPKKKEMSHGDNFDYVGKTDESGLMLIDMPASLGKYQRGDMVMINKGAPIENGQLGAVKIDGQIVLSYINRLDPKHIRLADSDHVYRTDDVTMIGPIVGGGEFVPIVNSEADDEWPEYIREEGGDRCA